MSDFRARLRAGERLVGTMLTLPLPELLSPYPRARETLHLLLLTALAPAQS